MAMYAGRVPFRYSRLVRKYDKSGTKPTAASLSEKIDYCGTLTAFYFEPENVSSVFSFKQRRKPEKIFHIGIVGGS
jgi:hypothetical protein